MIARLGSFAYFLMIEEAALAGHITRRERRQALTLNAVVRALDSFQTEHLDPDGEDAQTLLRRVVDEMLARDAELEP